MIKYMEYFLQKKIRLNYAKLEKCSECKLQHKCNVVELKKSYLFNVVRKPNFCHCIHYTGRKVDWVTIKNKTFLGC